MVGKSALRAADALLNRSPLVSCGGIAINAVRPCGKAWLKTVLVIKLNHAALNGAVFFMPINKTKPAKPSKKSGLRLF